MDMPRGPLPLNEADFLDFIYNYFKAEYAPIRWIFASTAEAVPLQPKRWLAMGDQLSPTSFRPADPRAHADLQSLEYCIRKWNLDPVFVKGIVVRYSKYRVHERLEKKLYEHYRGDLIVRKALKEKAMIDCLWPSPAPANLPKELLQQGVQVRQWYGFMFMKYFSKLRAEDDFTFRPEVAHTLKTAGTLMLVPYADHITAGPVEPIKAIVSSGAGFVNAPASRRNKENVAKGFGEPDRFEIRFDSPGEVQSTVARSVMRQCRCLKCGTFRDVQVAVLIDPTPGGVAPQSAERPSNPNTLAPRRGHTSKVSQRYTPGYDMPGAHDAARQAVPPQMEAHNATAGVRSPSPVQKKQCPACTFLNHPELTACEMCQNELPETLTTKPPSPVQQKTAKPAHAHSASLPANSGTEERPGLLNKVNRYSLGLGSTLYSISPFAAQQQQPPTRIISRPQQPMEQISKLPVNEPRVNGPLPGEPHTSQAPQASNKELAANQVPASKHRRREHPKPQAPPPPKQEPPIPPISSPIAPDPAPRTPPENDPPLHNHPELNLLPLSPPPTFDLRPTPLGLPQNLMDDYVPISPPLAHDGEVEDAGWGEVSKAEAKGDESEDEEDGYSGAMVDLDEVAREEMGVWGEREDDD
ncbi:uncharacterized protein N0V89_000413 [Didymosphaeria variabile]|uniref:RanBP2-type domain-containing protein n=1 Tax=Didymosphaeria variabile TaxID=1932322 RepID=A0A9W8XU86_9PLEO|nr:uncharacterized protein N0V89_000413 [Didymosphaeria variabile]KAJ4359857.1 hypothetical protein N0V89_000413 [Didymosphaeria variabile]